MSNEDYRLTIRDEVWIEWQEITAEITLMLSRYANHSIPLVTYDEANSHRKKRPRLSTGPTGKEL